MNTVKKDIVISFRVSAADAAHIDTAGEALKNPRYRSDFARAATLHFARQKVPAPVKPLRAPGRRKATADVQVLSRILGELGKIGSNVNQMARAFNQGGGEPSIEMLRGTAADLLEIKIAISEALTGKGAGNGD